MRVRLLGALLAATVLAALAAGPAGAAPEQVSHAEIRWRLGDRLDTRLTVSLAFSPARATGLAGTLAVRLFLSAARDPATGQLASVDTVPIAPAAADGEGIALPIAGAAALVRGTGDGFVPAGALATTAGVAFTAGSARVDVTDMAFASSAAGRVQGITATVAGVRRALTVAAADGSLTGEPGAMAAIALALGLPSVSVVTAAADAGFTRTGPA